VAYADPERQRAYQREWVRLRNAGDRRTPVRTELPVSFRLQTAQDILELLAQQVNAVREDANAGALEKARCVGYLAGIALRAVETAQLEARLTELENRLTSGGERNEQYQEAH